MVGDFAGGNLALTLTRHLLEQQSEFPKILGSLILFTMGGPIRAIRSRSPLPVARVAVSRSEIAWLHACPAFATKISGHLTKYTYNEKVQRRIDHRRGGLPRYMEMPKKTAAENARTNPPIQMWTRTGLATLSVYTSTTS